MPSTKLTLRFTLLALLIPALLILSGCGDSNEEQATPANVKSAAQMLQQAMSETQRSIDNTRANRNSLEKLKADLTPQISSTSDAINKLDVASRSQVEQDLYKAAVAQRNFLQYTSEAAAAKKWNVAKSNLAKARKYGRQASDGYADIGQQNSSLAGSLPDQGAFLTGSLRNNIRTADRKRKKRAKAAPATSSSTTTTSTGTVTTTITGGSCSVAELAAQGITFTNNTSCQFARDIAATWRSTGATYFEAWSDAKQTNYEIDCTDRGSDTVCVARPPARNAAVYIDN